MDIEDFQNIGITIIIILSIGFLLGFSTGRPSQRQINAYKAQGYEECVKEMLWKK